MAERFALGIDLGGTQVRAALVDESGTVHRRAAMRTDVLGGPVAVLAQMEQMLATVCEGDMRSKVVGLGICAPGPLDTAAGLVIDIPTLPGWQDFPVRQIAAELFGLPVVFENDGIAAAFGEWKFGAGRGLDHLVYVTVSTGIGGGVIVDRHLLHGRRGMAAHLGHMKLAPHGPRCSCGALGCFEAFAAGSALDRAAQAEADADPAGSLARYGKEGKLTGSDLVRAARDGDALALRLLDREAGYLGEGFTALLHLFSPDMIVMGGGVSKAFDLLYPGIDAVIQRTAMEPFREVPIVTAELQDNAGLVGVAGLVFGA